MPSEQEIQEKVIQDLAWILARQHDPSNQVVPGWSGFNQKISTADPPLTKIGPMPILNDPAHDFSMIWTVMQKCQAMMKKLGEKFTIFTFDEQL